MLVVLGIVLVLAVVGYFVLPPLSGTFDRSRGIDLLSEWLLTAKMRAKRDRVPTGVRLQADPSSGLYNQVLYIQQPDKLQGAQTGGTCKATNGPSTQILFVNVDFVGGAASAGQVDQALVQPGDYLQVNGGPVYQVQSVSVSANGTTVSLLSSLTVPVDTSDYLFYRQPRLLLGEDVKQLPGDLVIDLGAGASLNVPRRTVPGNGRSYYEILFGPTGAVVGQGTLGGKIVLWLRDNSTTSTPGPPTLIAVQTRTGFIAAYDVAPGTDPYAFTENGRAGGL
jgi:hypothetical protein